MPKNQHVPVDDLLKLAVEELDRSISQPNILSYKPYPEQRDFHCSEADGRYVAGGNRGGKTDAIVVDAIWWATNTHPFRKRPNAWGQKAIQLRFIVVDVEKGVNQIILPKLKRWVANSMLIDGSFDKSWNSQSLIFTFANGSTIDFLTHGMELDKHGGVPRHIIYFDEEPPQNIFNENMMRLIDYDGWWVIAATPVRGMGWTYDLLWEPVENAIANGQPHVDVDIFTLSAAKNPYLKAQNRTRFMVGMSEEERSVREEGKFVARSGLVFPQFNLKTHVIDADAFGLPPKNWEWYSSADVGWRHPTAWLWHAVSPTGDIVTFAEHYASEMTVAEHAVIIHERERGFGRVPDTRIGDPAMKQVTGAVGTSYLNEYANAGLYIGIEGIPHDVMIGVEKMQQYFRVRPQTGWGKDRPKWVISSNCVNLIRELKKLRWAAYASDKTAYEMKGQEKIHKKDDDAFDSARYFATLMPDLSGDGHGGEEPKDPDKMPTTISFSEMMLKLRADETVMFGDDIDNEMSTVTEWDTTEAWSEYV